MRAIANVEFQKAIVEMNNQINNEQFEIYDASHRNVVEVGVRWNGVGPQSQEVEEIKAFADEMEKAVKMAKDFNEQYAGYKIIF